jgi:PIN domain nuclease of toxin-antitoxin system
VRVLLDTHSFLWFITSDPKLSANAHGLIADPQNDVLISPASYWEVAIKVSLNKYPLTVPFEKFIDEGIIKNDFEILSLEVRHAAVLASLPFPPNHKDPFDRLIVAQAMAEGIPLVSVDPKLDAYSIKRLW